MNRLGTVLVFEPHVTPEQAMAALEPLVEAGLLSRQWSARSPEAQQAFLDDKPNPQPFRLGDAAFTAPYRLERFNDEMGGPVWYVP